MSQQAKLSTYATVDEAAKHDAFFAINNSDMQGTRIKGKIIMGIPTSSGETARVLLPATWLPIDLRTFARPEDLIQSKNLRDNHRNGSIILITKESVDDLKKRPQYAAEKARVDKALQEFSAGSNAFGAGPTTTEAFISIGQTQGLQIADAVANNANTEPMETPLTRMILNSDSDESIVVNFDRNLGGISLGEVRWLMQKALPGTLTFSISVEIESAMLDGGINMKTVRETEAYKEAVRNGMFS